MPERGSKPPVPERLRMPLRVATVVLGYFLYLYTESHPAAAVFIWVGFVALSWSLIERWTTRRHQRLGLLQVGQTILGGSLLALGTFLFFR